MRSISRLLVAAAAITSLMLASILPAAATHAHRPNRNMRALGHSTHPASFEVAPAEREVNSDLAFWGDLAFQGNYNGFRVIDISDPDDPEKIRRQRCKGDQGDLVVWENVLVRAWNSPAPEGRFCDGEPVPVGFEGVHVFDISRPRSPELVAEVELECGSHTLTMAGVSGGNLIVYSNNSSSFGCIDGTLANDNPAGDFMDVLSIPLGHPDQARLLRREPLQGPTTAVATGCHDAAVIRGSVNKAACASADTINVWDIGQNATPGGSIEDPAPLFTIFEPGVGEAGTNGRWHSAAFTWDGEVLVMGWEPGGGAQAECEAADPDIDKNMFFYDADTGAKLGTWVLPRPQGANQNCTIHNYNIVPLEDRYIAVSGNYQAGTWVTDFTDPANARALAWSDPRPLGPGPFCDPDAEGPLPGTCRLGGAWSSYWYNNFIYESDITRGLNVFRKIDRPIIRGAMELDRLNPQTQEFSM